LAARSAGPGYLPVKSTHLRSRTLAPDVFAEGNAMARPVHFELYANDFARMRTFYEAVFGWSFVQQGDRWAIRTGTADPGIDGTMVERVEPSARGDSSCGLMLRMRVDNIDEASLAVENHGGRITVPTIPVPGIGLFSIGTDPDGNYFHMVQEDPYPA
jgi:predicted enzyme related to lactoylglutathione lyase